MGLPGSEEGRLLDEAEASFQRPDCNELQRFLMYGAHLSISHFSPFFFGESSSEYVF